MPKHLTLIALAAAAALSGCSLIPNYERQQHLSLPLTRNRLPLAKTQPSLGVTISQTHACSS